MNNQTDSKNAERETSLQKDALDVDRKGFHRLPRRFLIFSLTVFALIVVVHPWVIDFSIRTWLSTQGMSIEDSDVDYAGFLWQGIRFESGGIKIELESLKARSRWKLVTRDPTSEALISAGELRVELTQKPAGEPSKSVSPAENVAQLIDTLSVIEKWLPFATVSEIEVRTALGQISVAEVEWKEGSLLLESLNIQPANPLKWDMDTFMNAHSISLKKLDSRTLRMRMLYAAEEHFVVNLRLEEASLVFNLSAAWQSGSLLASGAFLPESWGLANARLEGQGSAFPLGLRTDLALVEPEFTLSGEYEGVSGVYALSLDLSGKLPEEIRASGDRWTSQLLVSGDHSRIHLDHFDFNLPWLRTRLTESASIDLETLIPSGPIQLDWEVDLDRSPISHLSSGEGKGRFSLQPVDDFRRAEFRLLASSERWVLSTEVYPTVTLDNFNFLAEGSYSPQRIDLRAFTFSASSFGEASGKLQWIRDERKLSGLELQGSVFPVFLNTTLEAAPLAVGGNGLAFSVRADGTLPQLFHSGELVFSKAILGEKWPFGLTLKWSGLGTELDTWSAKVERSLVSLDAEGSLILLDSGLFLTIDHFDETRVTGAEWKLDQPVEIKWIQLGDDGRNRLDTSPIQLSKEGTGRLFFEGQVEGIEKSRLRAEFTDISRADVEPWWVEGELPELSIERMQAVMASSPDGEGRFEWRGDGEVDAVWTSPRGRKWEASGSWQLDTAHLLFNDFVLKTENVSWLSLSGNLPLGLMGDAERVLRPRVDRGGALSLQAKLNAIERLPLPLQERLPFTVSQLNAELNAAGTLGTPTATFTGDAATFSWHRPDESEPVVLRDLRLRSKIEGNDIEVSELALLLPNESTHQSVTGRIGAIDWPSWIEDPRVERWVELSARLLTEDWPVSSAGRLLPDVLEPAGRLSVDLIKSVGEWPKGTVSVAGLTSRPFADGLVLRGITGRALLNGRRFDDITVGGTIGAQPWELDGWLEGREDGEWLYRFDFIADRIDIARRSDLMLRARAELELVRETIDRPPLLRGEVEFLRSLWLRNLRDFTRRGAVSVARRPPYFSVESAGLRDWMLDLNLKGVDFLQVRATVLAAEASADFHLGGTLGDPILLGDATIEEGTLIFPFARLDASNLRALITEKAPHTVQLSGEAEGVAYGYTVLAQIGGTADVPTLVFASTPALPQQDILLLLATGTVPSGDTGVNISERAGRLALYLGQDIFSEIIGVDGASRIELRYGDGFSPFRKDSRVIEYQLNDDWSVLGEYDDFDGYNVDLRWRLIGR